MSRRRVTKKGLALVSEMIVKWDGAIGAWRPHKNWGQCGAMMDCLAACGWGVRVTLDRGEGFCNLNHKNYPFDARYHVVTGAQTAPEAVTLAAIWAARIMKEDQDRIKRELSEEGS